MEKIQELKNIISQTESILIVYNPNKGMDAAFSAIAFFNLLTESYKDKKIEIIPKQFLPKEAKNFAKNPKAICNKYYILEINAKNIEAIFFEKDDILKIYLLGENNSLKEDDIRIKEVEEVCEKCDIAISLGFDTKIEFEKIISSHNIQISQIACINNNENCENFGKINILAKRGFSLSELTAIILKNIDENKISKDIAKPLILGIESFWQDKEMQKKTLEIIDYLNKKVI